MRKIIMACGTLLVLAACSTSRPVITANPDRSNSTSGTLGSSPATDGIVPKSTDSLVTPKDPTVIGK